MEREMEMEMEIQDHLAVHAIGEDSSDAMVDEQEKKRPKTRLGCLTCKARRVKCDETKPACNRCLKFWGHCEGYPTSLPIIRRRRKEPIAKQFRTPPLLLRPRTVRRENTDTPPPPSGPTDSPPLLAEQEQNRHSPTATLRSIFASPLWTLLLHQSHPDEPFIHDATSAIRALSLCSTPVTHSPHYRFALTQYDRAIGRMRAALAEKKDSVRTALIACLLVVCFEALQGDVKQACEHAMCGEGLLREWVEQRAVGMLNGEVGGLKGREVEDELVSAFRGLGLQVLGCVDPGRLDVYRLLMGEGGEMKGRGVEVVS